MLTAYHGIYDVIDSSEPGTPEVRLTLKPEAEHLDVSLEDLSEQVRHGYFGDEVERLQRGRNEVKVMVRHPREERQSLDNLAAMPVQLPNGQQAPLGMLAEVKLTAGVAKLIRQDRRRVLKVQARVDPEKADVNALYSELEATELANLHQQYPGLSIDIGQERQDQEAMTEALKTNTLIALLLIYALIAVPFRSYLKPLIFLLTAPVAWCGAVLAHGLAGLPLSMESLVGMIAASGVVVNDSLVLLDYLKEHENEQKPIAELICEACTARFRPIFLAFLTNFAGFFPMLLETSEQAQFLIPMTLSLSAGLLLGMAASLILTPVCYAILGKA
jgi:multidrug efflux pump subunit AcrB